MAVSGDEYDLNLRIKAHNPFRRLKSMRDRQFNIEEDEVRLVSLRCSNSLKRIRIRSDHFHVRFRSQDRRHMTQCKRFIIDNDHFHTRVPPVILLCLFYS